MATCGSPKLRRPEHIDFSRAWKEQSGNMLAILQGLFRLIWLCGRGHHAVVLENHALRQTGHLQTQEKAFAVSWARALVLDRAARRVKGLAETSVRGSTLTRLYAGGGSVTAGTGRNGPRSREGWVGLRSAVSVRQLIRTIACVNPLRRAPRIHDGRRS